MLRQPDHTALLLFTRTREAEARAKDLSGKHHLRTNSLIADQLIGHAEKTARLSGLPCFVIDSNHQYGNSFGEKLANAFEAIYALGYKGVIAIGNDCPALTARDLITAANALETNGAVIGPAADGGVYLIGLQREAYNRSTFISLPWATDQLTDQLLQAFEASHTHYHTCTLKADIDTAPALAHELQNRLLNTTLRCAISSILASLHTRTTNTIVDPLHLQLRMSAGLRAPPVY